MFNHIAVDFDGTLFVNGSIDTELVEMLNKKYDGKVFIYTSRAWDSYQLIEDLLTKFNLKYKSIICGKLMCGSYLDDRNISIEEFKKENSLKDKDDYCTGCNFFSTNGDYYLCKAGSAVTIGIKATIPEWCPKSINYINCNSCRYSDKNKSCEIVGLSVEGITSLGLGKPNWCPLVNKNVSVKNINSIKESNIFERLNK